jgi:hypothetical protein
MKSFLLTVIAICMGFLTIGTLSGDVMAQDQGDTPGFWKNNTEAWAFTGYSQQDSFNETFGVYTKSQLSFHDALNLKGGGANALSRHAVAALLNAAHSGIDYPYDTDEIISIVSSVLSIEIQLLGNEETAEEALENAKDEIESWKDEFVYWNEISYHPAD